MQRSMESVEESIFHPQSLSLQIPTGTQALPSAPSAGHPFRIDRMPMECCWGLLLQGRSNGADFWGWVSDA